ncbi:MAG TPA: AAA family ATPase [Kiritimatiellia bacterium]|jgi:predicted ATPase|nr:AAA family ATPase [Kiritimatiellia bacterium]OQC58897.1 MAG: recombination protein F [Verrucomicrobia bacterium ADurb.Bin018]HOR78594.1 AAA family ATPase [Anaerolineaceae bacterium]HQF20583.1 AAA family ATPase [Kiritimatiellia bacterium]HQG74630.1 AAA family ATPase [Kiritimatiellia bacterium]
MRDPVFITRVVLNNYKSIKECSVRLGPLAFLVGQNGAGKSNFLDALRLVSDALNTSLEHALRDRGGINEVRRRSSGHPTHFGIRLEWKLPEGTHGIYAFRIGAQKKGAFEVQQEECRIFAESGLGEESYKVENGVVVKAPVEIAPPASNDRLYLVAAAGLPTFRPIYDALSHMGFYNFNPDTIRDLQPPDPGIVLKRDGSNLASVLGVMERDKTEVHKRVLNFLSKVVPGIQGIDIRHIGKKETLEFRQLVGTNKDPWRFMAENMSDGTLRALGVLTALFQSADNQDKTVPFVGIEEPEAAVHPGAAGVLRDGLRSASLATQIAVTSHSPDLLDDKEISDAQILAVVNRNGETIIAPLDEAGRSVIKERLFTAGELMRLNQLGPDKNALEKITPKQLELFAEFEP